MMIERAVYAIGIWAICTIFDFAVIVVCAVIASHIGHARKRGERNAAKDKP